MPAWAQGQRGLACVARRKPGAHLPRLPRCLRGHSRRRHSPLPHTAPRPGPQTKSRTKPPGQTPNQPQCQAPGDLPGRRKIKAALALLHSLRRRTSPARLLPQPRQALDLAVQPDQPGGGLAAPCFRAGRILRALVDPKSRPAGGLKAAVASISPPVLKAGARVWPILDSIWIIRTPLPGKATPRGSFRRISRQLWWHKQRLCKTSGCAFACA